MRTETQPDRSAVIATRHVGLNCHYKGFLRATDHPGAPTSDKIGSPHFGQSASGSIKPVALWASAVNPRAAFVGLERSTLAIFWTYSDLHSFDSECGEPTVMAQVECSSPVVTIAESNLKTLGRGISVASPNALSSAARILVVPVSKCFAPFPCCAEWE